MRQLAPGSAVSSFSARAATHSFVDVGFGAPTHVYVAPKQAFSQLI